ncbi:hypothetical protein Q7P37_003259 [Cladosporium fusiforme]
MYISSARISLIGLSLLATQRWRAHASEHTSASYEPAFGIELTLDDLRVAFAVPDAPPVELVSVQGGEAYQRLMQSYLELCERVQEEQVPPWDFFEYRNNLSLSATWREMVMKPETSWHNWFQVKVKGKPEVPLSVLERDNFIGDPEVAILAEAMARARAAAEDALGGGLNDTTMPQRPFVAIAAPSFLWTTIHAKPWDGQTPDWGDEDRESIWHQVLSLKFAGAAHRSGFRRHQSKDPLLIMESHATLPDSPINPAGSQALHSLEGEFPTENTAVVVELNKAALSFWIEGPRTRWTPWSTYRGLGGRQLQTGDTEQLWAQVTQALERLLEALGLSDEPLFYILTGDAWDVPGVESFKHSMKEVTPQVTGFELKTMFAASLGTARTASYALHTVESTCHPMELPDEQKSDHDEL